VLHAAYLREIRSAPDSKAKAKQGKTTELGIVVGLSISVGVAYSIKVVGSGSEGTYLGLIIAWAGPFILILWYCSLERMSMAINLLNITTGLWHTLIFSVYHVKTFSFQS
jgi:hypothetical protein